MNTQPLYNLRINCVDCNFTLSINDIKFLEFRTGANLNTELPINTFLHNGINLISCEIHPTTGIKNLPEIATVKIVITKTDNDTNASEKIISTFTTPLFSHSEKAIPITKYLLNGEFIASVVYNSRLKDGLTISTSDFTIKELFNNYMYIFNLFRVKDLDGVIQKLKTKIIETASLKGIDQNELEKEIRLDYETYLNDASLELWEFTLEKLTLKLYYANKLACFEIKNGNQPICFINREAHYSIYIPFYFYRNPDSNKFEIIR